MAPFPAEAQHPTQTNVYAGEHNVLRFLEEFVPPGEVATSVLMEEGETRTEFFQKLGLPENLDEVEPLEDYRIVDAEVRVFQTNQPDVYITQKRKANRFGVQGKAWGFTSLFKLGQSINERYRHELGLK